MKNISKDLSQLKGNRTASKMRCNFLMHFVAAAFAMLFHPHLASAAPLLGSDLASFTVLGASTVTDDPPSGSTIVGNVGVWSSGGANAISGFDSSPGVGTSDPQVTDGLVYAGGTLAESAQGQLTIARNNLSSLGAGVPLIDPDLTIATYAGSALGTLYPGIYTVPAGTTNLSGALTLDGQGNANAAWVFQMPSTLITSPNSVVNMINTGSGAGLYWNVGSSATIDVNTTFLGNILALVSISMKSTATDLCGRALADTGAVTLIQNSLSGVCTGDLAGSDGLSGGLDVISPGEVEFLPFAPVEPVPEPSTILLLGAGLGGLAFLKRRSRK